MCVIRINLNTATPDGTTITSANGRYRKIGNTKSLSWINFTINLTHPNTPNITVLGLYELQVNVTNNVGVTSEWALGSFEVSLDCTGGGGGGGQQTTELPDPSCCTSLGFEYLVDRGFFVCYDAVIGNGDNLITVQACDAVCGSGWEIVVPMGASQSKIASLNLKYLTIQKTGLASYTSTAWLNAISTCDNFNGVNLNNGISNEILTYGPFSESTTFNFGLDAAQNAFGTAESILTVRTYNGVPGNTGTVNLTADNFRRTHRLNATGTGVIHC